VAFCSTYDSTKPTIASQIEQKPSCGLATDATTAGTGATCVPLTHSLIWSHAFAGVSLFSTATISFGRSLSTKSSQICSTGFTMAQIFFNALAI
jgi:hypothetical protein